MLEGSTSSQISIISCLKVAETSPKGVGHSKKVYWGPPNKVVPMWHVSFRTPRIFVFMDFFYGYIDFFLITRRFLSYIFSGITHLQFAGLVYLGPGLRPPTPPWQAILPSDQNWLKRPFILGRSIPKPYIQWKVKGFLSDFEKMVYWLNIYF